MPLVAAGTRTTTGAAPVRGTAMTTTTIAAARVRAVAMTMTTIAADVAAAGAGTATRRAMLKPRAAVRTMMKIAAARGRAVATTTMTTTAAVAAGAGVGTAIQKGMPRLPDGAETTTNAADRIRGAATTTKSVEAGRARAVVPTITAMADGSVIRAGTPRPPGAVGKTGVEPAKVTACLTAGRHRRPTIVYVRKRRQSWLRK
jgi:hypothetical protein